MSRAAQPYRLRLLSILLVLAMLCAQWIGLNHGVAHADGPASWSSVTHGPDGEQNQDHSCSLLDAATLGAGLHSAPFTLPLLANVHVLALWTAFASWNAPFACHFSSRAPPQA